MRNRVLATGFFGIFSVLAGCASGSRVIVVQRIEPAEKTFTVIPISFDTADVNFAAWVEAEVGRAGLTVYERPPFKFAKLDGKVTTSESSSMAGGYGNVSAGWAVASGLTEPVRFNDVVSMYPDAKGAYLVITNASNNRIRIIERASGALVASGRIPSEDGDQAAKAVYSMLVYAGFTKDGMQEKSFNLVSRSAALPSSDSWGADPKRPAPFVRILSK